MIANISNYFTYNLSSKTLYSLKLFAFILMFVDHSAILLFNDNYILRFIGRLAYPIFMFITVYNFKFNTSSRYNYLIRLIFIALLSQYPYYLAFEVYTLNIFFSFFFALSAIYFLQSQYNNYIKLIVVLTFFFFSHFADYGLFGFLITIILYHFFTTYNYWYITLILLLSMFLPSQHYLFNFMYLYAFIFLFLLLIFNKEIKTISINKYFGYLFYPLHLLILLGVSYGM